MMFSPHSARGTRVLGMVVLVVTFAAGAIAATAIDEVLHAEPGSGTPVADDGACEGKRGHLLDRLDLSQDQRARIDSILERRRVQTDRFWTEAGPTLGAIMDSTRAEIRAVLTPAQRETYERLRRERKAAEEADRDERSETREGAGR